MFREESQLQEMCVNWFGVFHSEYNGLLFSVPNGTPTSPAARERMKREGMVSGVSDLVFLLPKNNCGRVGVLCIEMKVAKGRQSKAQMWWQGVTERAGNTYCVCRSLEEFQRVVEWWIGV